MYAYSSRLVLLGAGVEVTGRRGCHPGAWSGAAGCVGLPADGLSGHRTACTDGYGCSAMMEACTAVDRMLAAGITVQQYHRWHSCGLPAHPLCPEGPLSSQSAHVRDGDSRRSHARPASVRLPAPATPPSFQPHNTIAHMPTPGIHVHEPVLQVLWVLQDLPASGRSIKPCRSSFCYGALRS